MRNIYLEKGKPSFSFEIFPPKGSNNLSSVYETVDALASLTPDFISVTYGAGGSSRDNTADIASAIETKYNVPALAHLTCMGSTQHEIDLILKQLQEQGVKNILAMRGDLIPGSKVGDFKHADALISYIKANYAFNVLGACYPEKHIEAYSMAEDLNYLKHKVECGVDALITQLFFDNTAFYSFMDQVRHIGIDIPIIAGIMPITAASQLERMVSMCGASIPKEVQQFVKAYGHNSMAMKEAGISYATNQIIDLLANGVDGIHIYTMNKPEVAKRIVENLRGILYALRVKRA